MSVPAIPLRSDLYAKYNVAGPRYTSYPTVPYWAEDGFDSEAWSASLVRAFQESNTDSGISVYVHLPFCERLCTFCGCTKRITRNHAVETPYVDAVLAEWAMYRALWDAPPRVRELHFGGGTPTFFAPAELARLVRGLLDGTERPADAEYGFEAHPNSTTPEHLAALHELGFQRLSLGVQDFDPEVQKVINRIQPYERVAEVTRAARDIGYTSINFDLVYGLPRQRLQSVTDTVTQVLELRPERIAFYSYAHVPWIRGLGQRGFDESDLPRDVDKRALYETGRRMLEDAGYREIGMDHFALAGDALYTALETGHLHRNFMGYTPTHTQLCAGLGMSAIGDTWYAFAQNEKKVEDYQARIAAGELPLLRGHLLSDEDQRIRRHVLELMCRFRTRWGEDADEAPLLDEASARLAEMAEDGLVELAPGELRVTEAGRPFVRNVCMALDVRLWRNQPATRIFSQTI